MNVELRSPPPIGIGDQKFGSECRSRVAAPELRLHAMYRIVHLGQNSSRWSDRKAAEIDGEGV